MGIFENPQREISLARQLDPLSPVINASLGWFPFLGGQFEDAIRALRQVTDFDDTFAFAHYALSEAYLEQGDLDQGVAALERAIRPEHRHSKPCGLGATALGALRWVPLAACPPVPDRRKTQADKVFVEPED